MSSEPTKTENAVAKKWDVCIENTLIKGAYGFAAGAVCGLLLFRSPVVRASIMSFGAGIGSGISLCENKELFAIKKE